MLVNITSYNLNSRHTNQQANRAEPTRPDGNRIMNRQLMFAVFTVTLFGAGCGSTPPSRLNGTGTTHIEPLMAKWTQEYRTAKNVNVAYNAVGARAGLQRLRPGVFDFACIDGPLTDEQLAEYRQRGEEVVQIPVALGAMVPVYNVESITDALTFSGPVLADIYLGKITNWNHQALRQLNPQVTLPDQQIVVLHRTDGSGATYIWTDYLSRVSPAWKSTVGMGSSVTWPVGIGVPGNEGVTRQVKKSAGAIGYVSLSHALQHGVPCGKVTNSAGNAVEANLTSVTAAATSLLADMPADFRLSLANARGKDSYPICGSIWAIFFRNQSGAQGQATVNFFLWVLREGQSLAQEVHYAPLPKELVSRIEAKLAP